MKCPVCTEIALVMSERQGVEIDYCPVCRGVWLDRGELDKIIERSASAPAPQPAENHDSRRDHDDDHDEHKGGFFGGHDNRRGRKRSWLGEIFD